jgi:hypothetical protein
MAATTGTILAKGLSSGVTFSIDCYIEDAVGGVWRFDSGAGAGATSAVDYAFPENVAIIDVSMAGAPTATRGRFTGNGVPSASVIRYGNHLYSLNNRPMLFVKVKAGTRLGCVNL